MGSELTTVTVKKDLGFTADTFVKILSHCIMKIKKETGHWELLVRTSLCHFMHKKYIIHFLFSFLGHIISKDAKMKKDEKKRWKCQHFSCEFMDTEPVSNNNGKTVVMGALSTCTASVQEVIGLHPMIAYCNTEGG